MNLISFFTDAYSQTPTFVIILEAITFIFGIASVWLAKQENIWVYPTGLIATTITVYLFYRTSYIGDMVVNFYYSIMSVYGWYKWSSSKNGVPDVEISKTSSREKIIGTLIFVVTCFIIYGIYIIFDHEVKTENYIDIFVSGIFFTAMWFMALKKIENWTLWIIADLIAVPLYAYRGYGILSVEYLIFTALAITAYIEWRKLLNQKNRLKLKSR